MRLLLLLLRCRASIQHVMKNKVKHKWQRLPKGEGMVAYSLFLMYLEMGNDGRRSVQVVAERSGRSPGLVQTLCTDNQWVARAKAYDDYLIQVQTNAIENSLKQDAITWAKRRSIYREKEHGVADSLMEKAMEMVAHPLYRETVTKMENINGTEVAVAVTIEPAKWTLRDIPLFVKTAAEVMRLSLEMETSRSVLKFDIEKDPEARLSLAKAAMDELREKIPALVNQMAEEDPTINREELLNQYEQYLPQWQGEDWKVDPVLLIEEDAAGLAGVEPPTESVN